jgi:hypothetical protein
VEAWLEVSRPLTSLHLSAQEEMLEVEKLKHEACPFDVSDSPVAGYMH